jgi:hypothetical protein
VVHPFDTYGVQVGRIHAIPLGMSIGLASAVLAFQSNRLINAIPSCPIKALTGKDCPGCGTGRALAELSHLNISKAFDQNALSTLLIIGLVGYGIGLGTSVIKFPSLRNGIFTTISTPLFVIAIFALFWLARIASWPLGEYLASGIYSK